MGGWYWNDRVHFLGPFLDSFWGCGVGRSAIAIALNLAIAITVGLALR
jgi:hypothetical protein